MKLSVTLNAERLIKAPPRRVWEAFIRLTGLDAVDGEQGFLVNPPGLKVRVPARLLSLEPLRSVAWRAGWLGIQSNREFHFLPEPGGTRVRSVERLEGWPLLAARIFVSPSKLGQKNQDWLGGLAKQAEGPDLHI